MKPMKILALILAVVMTLGLLAGCGGTTTPAANSGNDTPAPATNSGNSTPAANSGSDTPAPANSDKAIENIIIEMVNFGYNDPDLQAVEDAMNAITEEKIGVHIHFLTVPISEMATKLGLMVAGNEDIDMVSTGLLCSPAQLVAQGLLMPLTDYIENSEILKAKAGSLLEACKVGDELYAYPGQLYVGEGKALYYDKDLAAEYGIDMPETFSDPMELGAVFQAVLDSGMPVYPVSLGDGHNQEMNFGNMFEDLGDVTLISYGAIMDPYNGTTVEDWYETDTYEKQVRMVQDWFEKGYVLPDSLSNGLNTHTTMEYGQCFSFFGPYATGTEDGYWSNSTHHNVGHVRYKETRVSTANVIQTSWGIASTSKHPEAVIKFAELIYTDAELATLYRYGIEGKDYVTTPGSRVIVYPEGVDSGSVGYGSFIPFFGDDMELPVLTPRDESFYDVYEAMSIENVKPYKFLGYTFDPSNVMSEVTAVQAIITKYGRALNVGATNVDEMLPKFREELKTAGMDTIIAENQKQVDAWLANR